MLQTQTYLILSQHSPTLDSESQGFTEHFRGSQQLRQRAIHQSLRANEQLETVAHIKMEPTVSSDHADEKY